MSRKSVHPAPSTSWVHLSDEKLLRARILDLRLSIDGTALEKRIARLYAELYVRGITFRPRCYLSDEWLCPDGLPVIGIPFYLAHPRLTHLERRMMLEAEGAGDAECMRLLRHETGHALDHFYRFSRRTRWREVFGSPAVPYNTMGYSAQPYSKRYVVHLDDNYAQSHPDEDFAETFAVWLTPSSDWERAYRGWPVIAKLRYVDDLMARIRHSSPRTLEYATPYAAARMRSTLETYYERKRSALGHEFPGFYDPGLRRIFSPEPPGPGTMPAADYLRRHRRQIVSSVSMWTQRRKYDIDKLIRKLVARCDGLGLWVKRPGEETICEVTSLVTAVMCTTSVVKGVMQRV